MVKSMTLALLVCIFVFPVLMNAEDYYIQWTDIIINSGFDQAWDVASDNADNIIVVGRYRQSGNDNYLIVKYDPNGDTVWTRTVDNGAADGAYAVAVDQSDNIVVTGYSNITGTKYFTIKYDANGNILWADTLNGSNTAKDVAVGTNRVYVTGITSNDIYTAAYNSNGTFLGSITTNNGGYDSGEGVAVDNSGNFIVVGYSGVGGNDDYYIAKYNSLGGFIWADTIDNGGHDRAYDVAVDWLNNIIVTGESAVDGDYDYFTVKYDSNGTILWADTLDRGEDDKAWSVAVDYTNNVIVTGQSRAGSYYDIYTVKYSSDGTILWTDVIDNGQGDYGYGVAADVWGNIVVTGTSKIGDDQFFTVKYAPLIFDSLVVFTPEPDSLSADGIDSTKVITAVYAFGGQKLSGLSSVMSFSATLGSFYGDVLEDTDTTYYQWYRAGTTVGEAIIWVYAGSVDSAMTTIYLIDSDSPVIVWWDSLPDDTTSIPEDTLFGPYPVQAEMYDVMGDIAQAWLYWNGDSVEMNSVSGDTFMAEIPEQIVLLGDSLSINYYIKVWDASANLTQTETRTFTIYHYDVGIEENVSIPQVYALGQNFPNPFSKRSIVTYQLPIQSYVSLVAYNALGQCVRTLVNEIQQPGYYSTSWDGQDDTGKRVANGIYFYRLDAGDFVCQKKMLLVK